MSGCCLVQGLLGFCIFFSLSFFPDFSASALTVIILLTSIPLVVPSLTFHYTLDICIGMDVAIR